MTGNGDDEADAATQQMNPGNGDDEADAGNGDDEQRSWLAYEQGTRDRISFRAYLARQYFGLEQEDTAGYAEREYAVDTEEGYAVWSLPGFPDLVLVRRPGPPGKDSWLSLERRLDPPPGLRG